MTLRSEKPHAGFPRINEEVKDGDTFRDVSDGYPVSGDRLAEFLFTGFQNKRGTRRFYVSIDIWKGVRA